MAILIHDPTYKDLSGFTAKKAPYPCPRCIPEAQANLRFFRDQAGLSQADAAKAVNRCVKSWELWEHQQPKKGLVPIPANLIARVATMLKCNHDLINPALPFMYKDSYKKYPPILVKNKRIFCIEQPEEAKDFINNVNYFCLSSDLSLDDIAFHMDCVSGTLSSWRKKTLIKEESAIQLAKILKCPKELIYLDKAMRLNKHKSVKWPDASSKLISPPQTLSEVKNNYAYYLAQAKLTTRDTVRMMGLNDDESSNQTVRNWKRQDISSYMDVSQALIFASRLNIPVNDVLPIYQQSQDALEQQSNITGIYLLKNADTILSLAVQSHVSGGCVLELEPSQCVETLGEILHVTDGNNALAAAKVVGDSMFNYETGEGIADGAFVLVDTNIRDFHKALDKVICFKVHGNELLIKRLKIINGDLCFCSDNPRYIPAYHKVPEGAIMLGLVITSFKAVS